MQTTADRPDLPDWLASIDPFASEQWLLAKDDTMLALAGHLSDRSRLPDSAKVITRFGDIVTLRLPRRDLPALASSGALKTLEGARRVSEPEDVIEEIDAAMPTRPFAIRPSGVGQDGRGVIVGVIDYGLDVFHPAFWHQADNEHAAPRSKVIAVWDQHGSADDAQENRWGYGRIIDRDEIERASKAQDPYATLGYRPWDSDRRNRGAHGTHVAGIACGTPLDGEHTGVAPGADLLFVSLGYTSPVLGKGDLGSSLSVLEALDWMLEQAGDRPIVVNLSVGAHSGHHNGRSVVERGIDEAVWSRPGRALVNSAGNYRNKRAHASGRLVKNAVTTLDIELRARDRNGSEIEVFYPAVDAFSVRLRKPDGDWTPSLEVGEVQKIDANGSDVGMLFHRHSPYHEDNHISLFLRPDAPAGGWQIELGAKHIEDGRYHAWIERDNSQQPQFSGDDIEQTGTIGTLANGRFSVTVGAYDPHQADEPLGDFSSLGPTRHGQLKPELAAPGVHITAARSTPRGEQVGSRVTVMNGTSMAAPMVTGALALLFAEAKSPLEISDTRALLLSSLRPPPVCKHSGCAKQDIHGIGHGYLNIPQLVAAGRNWRNGMQTESTRASTSEVASDATADPEVVLMQASLPEELNVESGYVGSLLVRASPGEHIDYRAVILDEPTDDFARYQGSDVYIEQRGPGLYAEVLELDANTQSAVRKVRQVFNQFGLLPQGQTIVPTAVLQAIAGSQDQNDDLLSDAALVDALPDLSAWRDLISLRPSVSVQRSLNRATPDRSVHRIEDAHGDINVDYYPVRIDQLPMWRGRRLSAEALLALIRSDINRFVDTNISSFSAYDASNARRWRSRSPVGAIIHIDMKSFGGWVNPDDGSVVCSRASANSWTFSTIWTLADFAHPVSGNREFGIRQRSSGVYEFYTRGADRTTGRLDNLLSGQVFGAADALWVSLQRRVAGFVSRNGGSARTLPRMSSRYDWPTVKRRYWSPSVRWL